MKFKCYNCKEEYNTFPNLGIINKNNKRQIEFYCHVCSVDLVECCYCKCKFHSDTEDMRYVKDYENFNNNGYFCETCYEGLINSGD